MCKLKDEWEKQVINVVIIWKHDGNGSLSESDYKPMKKDTKY